MDDRMRFGQFISEKRIQRSMTKQYLANTLGISVAYLCQLESGKRCNPNNWVLERIVSNLHLADEEIDTLYDLYSMANHSISPDISEYIVNNIIVSKAIRVALRNNATEQDWKEFIDRLLK